MFIFQCLLIIVFICVRNIYLFKKIIFIFIKKKIYIYLLKKNIYLQCKEYFQKNSLLLFFTPFYSLHFFFHNIN